MAPTARMAPWAGSITAVNSTTSYMPRLEMAKVPPEYSSGRSFLLRARSINVFGLTGDLAQALPVALADDGDDESVLQRHGHADVHPLEQAHLPVVSRRR